MELRPYVLGGVDRTVELDETSTRQEIGADAKWGVTTGLTADFTVNTDFAQEEADVQQINLTRFSLFFPEKRQIFLESERSFIFGVKREADLVNKHFGISGNYEINWVDLPHAASSEPLQKAVMGERFAFHCTIQETIPSPGRHPSRKCRRLFGYPIRYKSGPPFASAPVLPQRSTVKILRCPALEWED